MEFMHRILYRDYFSFFGHYINDLIELLLFICLTLVGVTVYLVNMLKTHYEQVKRRDINDTSAQSYDHV